MKTMLRPRSRYVEPLIHIVVWLCLFFYPFLFHYVHLSDGLALFRIASQLLLVVAFFYANLHIFIPRLLGKKHFTFYFLCAGISIAAVGYGSGYIELYFNPNFAHKHDSISVARTTGIVISLVAWVISSGLKITSEWFRSERIKTKVEKEKLQSELLFLKNQVNPHFLFNALNNIYSLEQLKSPHTGEAILKLSELMRYTLYETAAAFVPLEKEVNYLRNYVELQKMGISEEVIISFEVKGDTSGKEIEPMLLIPLVENAFKHGISYISKEPISILLSVDPDSLSLSVENSMSLQQKKTDGTNGIGLVNLKKRLELLYPSRYDFVSGQKGNRFFAKLKIKLNP